jgi:hypothetical protein
VDLNDLEEEDLVDEDALLDGNGGVDAVPTMRYMRACLSVFIPLPKFPPIPSAQ